MIIVNDEQALRVKCEDVLETEIPDLVKALENELNYSAKMGRPGIGLAAPQIGIAKNIAIVRLGKSNNCNMNINLVNCKITNAYDLKMFQEEGCLSFPGRIENTMRYQEIHVSNNIDKPNNFIATGLLAVVCQHELDHLNGILLPDKALIKPKIKIRPNDPCICGKKDDFGKIKKYKKCCGKE